MRALRALGVLFFSLCAHAVTAPFTGIASFYSEKHHGKRTSSGKLFNKNELTAAHRTLPFGTRVRVWCAATQRQVVVTITDRGPFVAGRIIDLSKAAAAKLGILGRGTARVTIAVVEE